MNPHPKVSVILTSYNHAKYLRDAIDSILNQTFSDFELIIWDDHSVDESWDIINQYTDPRISAYRNDEQKRGIWNINRAVSEVSQGEYVAIHHSDDIWETDKLEKQVGFLDTHPEVGAVFSNAFIIGENGEPFEDVSHFYYTVFEQPNRTRYEWLNYFFYHSNVLCHPSILIRKMCYQDCGLYRYGFGQLGDFDMWVRLCLKYNIHVLPEKLIRFRVRANEMNTSSSRPITRIRHTFETYPIYNNFRSIKTSDEFVKIFPTAQKYFTQEDYDLGFALGMTALDADGSNVLIFFGLQLLFETLNNPERAKKIKELYDFTYIDFIALTGRYDLFSIELIPTLSAQLVEKEHAIHSLTSQLAEKEQAVQSLTSQIAEYDAQLKAVYASSSWRITAPIRAIRTKFRQIRE